MDKGKGTAKDNVLDDSINGMDDDYNDMLDYGANPNVPLNAMGSNFEEDEEDMAGVADTIVGIEGATDIVEGADMDALESSNMT
ncbi:hypothetical protein WN943_029106 [Citrus x changshan-huyou]